MENAVSLNLEVNPTTNGDSFFDFLDQESSTRGNARSNAIIIKRPFLERAIVPQEMDPLLWIRVNQMDFPSIKTLMLKYLFIPAISVESERVFSKAGQIVSDRRARLKEEKENNLQQQTIT
ncbi:uncharacterized protein LOC117789114 [Drosophila innubila]|uniref:uncharacterized protein LOC117789114 n=1 Tax=Drosophila innubila TaxID=198719 RepID=UPI00148C31C3|nr:uncharacterized protein LOC117789114 [Drosophila innubila]